MGDYPSGQGVSLAKAGLADAQLREQVKALAEKFLTRTEGQIGQLREHVRQLRAGDADALQAIQELAHKIHGSGAMFGFAALSQHGGEIERLSVAQAPGIEDQLDGLIDALAGALEQVRSAP
jgi:HPt (histidine-containing phosphotransfer) domain-containing protein